MKEPDRPDQASPAGKERSEGPASSLPDPERLRRHLARSIDRVCPPWLAAFKDDILQNAMVRVLQILEKDEHNSSPPASYIWKVAYSATVDQIRRIRRRREVPIGEGNPVGERTEEGSDPFRDQAARELGEGIQACLNRLAERRRLVVGFHLLGHTLSEIETLLDWKPKTVRNLLYRGLADLRRCLISRGLQP